MRRQRAIVRAFEQAGALAADRACSAEELGVRVDFAWQQLASLAVLRSPASGRWFLDRANWQRLCRRRCVLAAAVVVGLLLMLLFAYSMSWR
ncbi:hypothetical protein [Rhodanobacter geophilus]|uniref:Uncharacterized protein n=1 Tax=Rhodanobacter geophilus TaxID=3162488 RepID=A0ABV3QJI3_9GAMM